MASRFVTIDRRRLDAFLSSADKLSRLVLRVGILSGRDRYPRKRRHDPADTKRLERLSERGGAQTRLGAIRMLNKQLKELGRLQGARKQRQAEREIRRALKAQGLSSKGLVRRGKRGTAVARVAGVHQAGTSYHTVAIDRRRPSFRRELDQVQKAMLAGKNVAPLIISMGERFTKAVKAQVKTEDLWETGRLFATIDFEIVDRVATEFRRRVSRQRRAARRGRRRRRR